MFPYIEINQKYIDLYNNPALSSNSEYKNIVEFLLNSTDEEQLKNKIKDLFIGSMTTYQGMSQRIMQLL